MSNLAGTTAAATFREGKFAGMPAALPIGCTYHATDTGDFWVGTATGNVKRPAPHAANHAKGGSDPITPQSIGAVPVALVPVTRTGTATLPAIAINAVVTITITWMVNGVATPFADTNYIFSLPMIVTAAGLLLNLSPTSFTKYPDKITFTVTSLSALTAGYGVASSIATHN